MVQSTNNLGLQTRSAYSTDQPLSPGYKSLERRERHGVDTTELGGQWDPFWIDRPTEAKDPNLVLPRDTSGLSVGSLFNISKSASVALIASTLLASGPRALQTIELPLRDSLYTPVFRSRKRRGKASAGVYGAARDSTVARLIAPSGFYLTWIESRPEGGGG